MSQVKPIEWTEKLAVDGDVIDRDHKFLLKIINNFRAQVGHFNSADEAMEILNYLKLYAEKHFVREESLQMHVVFPYREAHHNAHIFLMKQLDNLMMETKEASGAYLNGAMGEKLSQFLQDWLIDHLIESDLRMKPFVEKMNDMSKDMGELED